MAKKKDWLLLVAMLSISLVILCGIAITQPDYKIASAIDYSPVQYESAEVYAIYDYVILDDSTCSVKIANKEVATQAVIPGKVNIDGKDYMVTEIALNGFASSIYLKRVSVPYGLRKIGNSAFVNCQSLETVSLSNVQEIGNNAFMRCTKLSSIIIPKSVTVMGATVFRFDDTQIMVRNAYDGENWSTNWNANNANSEVEYNSKYEAPTEYIPLYESTRTRGIDNQKKVGYAIAGGQPFSEDYYNENGIIEHLTPTNPEDGLPVLEIESFSYEDCGLDMLIVDYDETPINIQEFAFAGTDCKNIIINRPVTYIGTDGVTTADNIFYQAKTENIVLPATSNGVVNAMFYEAEVKNILHIQPDKGINTEAYLTSVTLDGNVKLPAETEFNSIGDLAFYCTKNIKSIYIPSNITFVGHSVFDGWALEQAITIDQICDDLPDGFNTE